MGKVQISVLRSRLPRRLSVLDFQLTSLIHCCWLDLNSPMCTTVWPCPWCKMTLSLAAQYRSLESDGEQWLVASAGCRGVVECASRLKTKGVASFWLSFRGRMEHAGMLTMCQFRQSSCVFFVFFIPSYSSWFLVVMKWNGKQRQEIFKCNMAVLDGPNAILTYIEQAIWGVCYPFPLVMCGLILRYRYLRY